LRESEAEEAKAVSRTRAQRYPIQVALRYRTASESEWHRGQTENISRSGVLFQADRVLEVNTPVELSFPLPVEVGGEPGALVFCEGRIVRTVLPATTDARPALAAKILDFLFVRSREPMVV
jgi:hypothetical protein